MLSKKEELVGIVTKFAESSWDVIDVPSKAWLKHKDDSSKNYYQICSVLAPDLEIITNKITGFTTSMFDGIQNNKQINDILFNPDYGLCTLNDSDIIDSHIHLSMGGPSGLEYIIKKGDTQYELLLVESIDGWVIGQIQF